MTNITQMQATTTTTSNQDEGLIASLARAQGEMSNAPLNKVNPHFKSRYADLAAIRDSVVPALARHGIAIVQPIRIGEDGRLIVITQLMKGDETIESACPVMAAANAAPQAIGSALTYARRYSLAALVGIAAEEDDDANDAQEAAKQQKNTSAKAYHAQQKSQPSTQTGQPSQEVNKSQSPVNVVNLPLHEDGTPNWNAFGWEMEKLAASVKTLKELNDLLQQNNKNLSAFKESAPADAKIFGAFLTSRRNVLSQAPF